jgi:ABC-2 type transport system permease protein
LLAGTALSVLQMAVFLVIAWLFGVTFEPLHLLAALPVMVLAAVLLASLGLMLSVYVKQLENFAGTMNFVIFPMFFISPALYPLWKLEEAGAQWLLVLASWNPFSHAVEAMRFALYGQFNALSLGVWRWAAWCFSRSPCGATTPNAAGSASAAPPDPTSGDCP